MSKPIKEIISWRTNWQHRFRTIWEQNKQNQKNQNKRIKKKLIRWTEHNGNK